MFVGDHLYICKKSVFRSRAMPGKIVVSKKEKTIKEEKVAMKAVAKRVDRYVEAVGRRKTAIARVRLTGGRGEFAVNGKNPQEYFKTARFSFYAESPLTKLKLSDKYNVNAKVIGGGMHAQAEAVRLGLSRALVLKNPDFKRRLRKLEFLTRDSRMVERKKYGLKKARRAPQWAKR